ncbi:uncharacterized protein K460DRAFT_293729 [Cucurbitaria berberidis CBS 394.84]|uniref:Zinc-ribbon domain-containing protein n=1 Tax=Cucurbitaria berberidis CBS 394.84 TaxID=1168544 RepID=A0A9P4L434_9PLEO|nr:uncharacterized protein K460DRAFT_293729 [Cucurbitaria berberidis CBS 394.84]KAF1841596.1 hypothetical protein K460DRAFT_293729 [Cucurbitaria berberidis CBS 394.84]
MQSTIVLVNAHSDCPKCGASISGDAKTCGSCGSVSHSGISKSYLDLLSCC